MRLPKEIQNLILIRYYFNQWKEKIEKVNQQYFSSYSFSEQTPHPDFWCLAYNNRKGKLYFLFNHRICNNSFCPHSHYRIHNVILYQQGIKDKGICLPKYYFFSSGYPSPYFHVCNVNGWNFINIYKYKESSN